MDVYCDTTVGDVLAKARAAATDPALSEQKYISLCKVRQEIAAPMLPVNLLIDWTKNKTAPLARVPIFYVCVCIYIHIINLLSRVNISVKTVKVLFLSPVSMM